MPEITFGPLGEDCQAVGEVQSRSSYSAAQRGNTKANILMGCFSVGLGTFLSTSHNSSLDIGAYVEGRFGDLEGAQTATSVDVNNVRGVIRGGVFLWR